MIDIIVRVFMACVMHIQLRPNEIDMPSITGQVLNRPWDTFNSDSVLSVESISNVFYERNKTINIPNKHYLIAINDRIR